MNLIGMAGSLRQGSYNGALLRAAAGLMPAGSLLRIETLRGIPLYDGDLESGQGLPEAVSRLKDAIAAADGLVLATPEYNNAMPGVFKNAIDWLSRPPADIPRVFRGKPVALMGATPGQGGTRLGQAAWLPVLRTLGTTLWSGRQLYVAGAAQVFDGGGQLVDARVRERLSEFLEEFVRFTESR